MSASATTVTVRIAVAPSWALEAAASIIQLARTSMNAAIANEIQATRKRRDALRRGARVGRGWLSCAWRALLSARGIHHIAQCWAVRPRAMCMHVCVRRACMGACDVHAWVRAMMLSPLIRPPRNGRRREDLEARRDRAKQPHLGASSSGWVRRWAMIKQRGDEEENQHSTR